MNTYALSKINEFAKEFVSSIIEGKEQGLNDYGWEISFRIYELEDLFMNAKLVLYDGDCEEVSYITYEVIRDQNIRYTYNTTFSFDDTTINEQELKEAINSYEDGLYDKICTYLHRYAMERMYYGDDDDCPPTYDEEYSPSSIKAFMKKYGISPYVPIDIELVDAKGLTMRYFSIDSIGFNDESNRLMIFLK